MTTSLQAAPTLAWTASDQEAVHAVLFAAWQGRHGLACTVKELSSGRYLAFDADLATRLGLADPQGRTDAELFDASLSTALRAAEQTALAQGAPLVSEHAFDAAGMRHQYEVTRLAVERGGRRWLAAVWHDQAPARRHELQLRSALEQIERQQQEHDRLRREMADHALRDPDTGLHRRTPFDEQLKRELDLSTREHREFSLVLAELDPPSEALRALGPAGEQALLLAVGRLLRSGTRAMDASARYGERRFAVLLSGVGLATAHSRMEGLRRKCASQIVVHEGQEFGFTVAMGVASFPHTAQAQDALLAACEAALAEARRRGGNAVTLAAIRFDGAPDPAAARG
jgi:diguanylate cyclase (GGDEF)-like protein